MKIHIPSALRRHTGGHPIARIDRPGATVASALEALFEIHPGVRDRLLTEQGRLRPHVALFVGSESIRYTGGFDTPVRAEDEMTILPAVSGG
ncbi:MAG: MoaD/ThiS family protein [Thermoanaerobaculia bacterium]|nr:MoaD/ThiS family protein [Thermoanaerobaculia bacterium]